MSAAGRPYARAADIAIIRYESVRDPSHRAKVAVLICEAFADPSPRALQTWHIFTRRHAVQVRCETTRTQIEFRREDLASDSRLR